MPTDFDDPDWLPEGRKELASSSGKAGGGRCESDIYPPVVRIIEDEQDRQVWSQLTEAAFCKQFPKSRSI